MKKSKKVKQQRLGIKLFLCAVYLILITILFVNSYKVYQEKKSIVPWSKADNVEEYTYIEVSKMSEKFAYYEETNIGIHFVIEKEDTGLWHTYIVAINEGEYEKYKPIIDYTYKRTDAVPVPIKMYGYPSITNQELKDLAIKNIGNFIPEENKIEINNENYDQYLTNSYLDNTKQKKESFSILFCISTFLLLTIALLFIMTIFNKDKIVDNLDEELDKTKELFKTKELQKILEKEKK